MEIERIKEIEALKSRLKVSSVVGILGPRQCGKTTLAHQFCRNYKKEKVHFFDMEDPRDLVKLENPTLALEELKGLIVIDEIQRKPNLFPVLRVLVDRNKSTKYIIVGSASRDLISQSSETLAGRISYLELGGFALNLLPEIDMKKLWAWGGFPRSYLAKSSQVSFQWRQDFITTFLERDIPNLGINIPAPTLRRFWIMISHYHGQVFNASEISRSFGTSDNTVKKYLDILSGTFMIRQLQPWFYNTGKRLVKRPKIYFRDSGIFHALTSLKSFNELISHPKLGASWEGFVIEQIVRILNLREEEIFFWAAHTGAELDLLFQGKGKQWGVEIKYNEAPSLTKSMLQAVSELSLEHMWMIYPGKEKYRLHKKVSVIPANGLSQLAAIIK